LLLYWRVAPLVHKLYLGDQRLRLALDSSRSAWWDWDLRNGTIELSEHWQAMLGRPARATVIQMEELEQLVHPEDRLLVERKLRAALKSRDIHYDAEFRVPRQDGQSIWISSVGKVVERDAQGQALRMIGINADISHRKESALRIEYQARHDTLTGLPNRATFYDRLAHAMSRTRRRKTLMAVMYLDVDRFKGINDSLGHSVGDLLLKDFAQRLAYCVRAVDTVARVGGDEFAVLLEDLKDRDDACRIAEKMVLEMQPEFPLEELTLQITISVGLAFYDGREELGADQLVRKADAALYAAKNSGRNTYQAAG
jgi:diguanylate cyclase (GGDEF)-like protein/PAS domain S-box-containing protein